VLPNAWTSNGRPQLPEDDKGKRPAGVPVSGLLASWCGGAHESWGLPLAVILSFDVMIAALDA